MSCGQEPLDHGHEPVLRPGFGHEVRPHGAGGGALALNEDGRLPMVLPTIETLRALSPYSDPTEALRHLGGKEIPRLLPRVEEAGDGVRMILENQGVCP